MSAVIQLDNTDAKPDRAENANYWPNRVVLVVEDDNISYQYIEALLHDTDLKLIHAKSGEDALKICQTDKSIDLVLMDVQLPFMSGYDATMKIKAIRDDLPIIAQTANVLNNERTRLLEAGCSYYITKPIDPDELFSVISKCLNSSTGK